MSSSNNTSIPPSGSQFQTNKPELALFGSPVQIRLNRNTKRNSNFAKMTVDEHNLEDNQQTRMSRSEVRRGSTFVRAMSEDMGSKNKFLIRSPKVDYRRGSSFIRTVDDSIIQHISSDRSKLDIRRCSSLTKTTEDIEDSGHSSKSSFHRCSSFTRNSDNTSDDTLSLSRSPKPDFRRGSSFIRTCDDSTEDSVSLGRNPRPEIRRGSSFIRMISEEIDKEELHSTGRLSSKPESRRGSGISKIQSEESSDDFQSRRSSRADMRRGSSLAQMISEEHDIDIEDNLSSEKSDRSEVIKALDNTNRESLQSICEYKTDTYSSVSMYPSIEYSSASPTSELSSDLAMRSTTASSKDTNADGTYASSGLNYLSWIESVNGNNLGNNAATHIPESENKFGEWSNFWSNYNSSKNEYFTSPYLCPSNSGEDVSLASNDSTQRDSTDKTNTENIVLSAAEVNEALECTQRLMDILRGAIKRAETNSAVLKNESDTQNISCKDAKKNNPQKEKSIFKSSNNSCIDVILNHTGVGDMLKRVINKRREVIMPPDESSGRSSASDWSKK